MKKWSEIEEEYAKAGRHHCLSLTCVKCDRTQTCRCPKPKTSEKGICPSCLKEATPKSTRERIYRHLRPKKKKPPAKHMKGRVVPKKTANNDPTRGGRRQHQKIEEGLKESLFFLRDHIGKTGDELRQEISQFSHQKDLQRLLEHMIAVGGGSWRRQNNVLINDEGRSASPDLWTVTEDGHLHHKYTKKTRPRNWNLAWLREARGYCERTSGRPRTGNAPAKPDR